MRANRLFFFFAGTPRKDSVSHFTDTRYQVGRGSIRKVGRLLIVGWVLARAFVAGDGTVFPRGTTGRCCAF